MRRNAIRQNDTTAGEPPADAILSYTQLCLLEGMQLRRGMVYREPPAHSLILTSQRDDAPYRDCFDDSGRVLLYEGHDVPRSLVPNPKAVDQPLQTVAGRPTENGKFLAAALAHQEGAPALHVAVYQKLRPGCWQFRGLYRLVAGWRETAAGRQVVRFRLERIPDAPFDPRPMPNNP